MNGPWAVVLREQGHCFGPFVSREDADHFADFLTREVDPADVRLLCSPVDEMYGFYLNIARPALKENLDLITKLAAHQETTP